MLEQRYSTEEVITDQQTKTATFESEDSSQAQSTPENLGQTENSALNTPETTVIEPRAEIPTEIGQLKIDDTVFIKVVRRISVIECRKRKY